MKSIIVLLVLTVSVSAEDIPLPSADHKPSPEESMPDGGTIIPEDGNPGFPDISEAPSDTLPEAAAEDHSILQVAPYDPPVEEGQHYHSYAAEEFKKKDMTKEEIVAHIFKFFQYPFGNTFIIIITNVVVILVLVGLLKVEEKIRPDDGRGFKSYFSYAYDKVSEIAEQVQNALEKEY